MDAPEGYKPETTLPSIPRHYLPHDVRSHTITTEQYYGTNGYPPVAGTKEGEVTFGIEADHMIIFSQIAAMAPRTPERNSSGERNFQEDFVAGLDVSIPRFEETLVGDEYAPKDYRGKVTRFLRDYLPRASGENISSYVVEDIWYTNGAFRKQVTACFINYYSQKGEIPEELASEALALLHETEARFLSPNFIGTSSAVLPGLAKAGGKFLSLRELIKRGMTITTGEVGRYGGAKAAREDGLSATRMYEVARTYAETSAEHLTLTREKLVGNIATLEKEIATLETASTQKGEDGLFTRERLADLVLQVELLRDILPTLPANGDKPTDGFPVIFGFNTLPVIREEANPELYSFRTGDEIELATTLDQVYCNKANIPMVQDQLNQMGVGARITPREPVELVRSFDVRLFRVEEDMRAYRARHSE